MYDLVADKILLTWEGAALIFFAGGLEQPPGISEEANEWDHVLFPINTKQKDKLNIKHIHFSKPFFNPLVVSKSNKQSAGKR